MGVEGFSSIALHTKTIKNINNIWWTCRNSHVIIEYLIIIYATLTIPSLSIGIAELIVAAKVLLIHFMDALTPHCFWWRNSTMFFFKQQQEVYAYFLQTETEKKNTNVS